MKILFHSEQLNYRGTTNSILDYATFNQSILGNECAIIYDSTNPPGHEVGTKPEVVEEFKQRFQVYSYNTEQELQDIASNFDFCYSQRAGCRVDSVSNVGQDLVKPVVTTTKFGVHAVFQWWDPHGDKYAYISEWLANKIAKKFSLETVPDFVPYIVDLPPPMWDMRSILGIPQDKIVIGRLGGFSTFDLDFVKQTIVNIVEERDDIIFLLANTYPFYKHNNIIHISPFFSNQEKSNYINACDAMIHGRHLGESFGLSVAEFLFHNKPVISWNNGFDQNHMDMLKDTGLLYNDENELRQLLLNIRDFKGRDYHSIVDKFSPRNVMQKFESVYLR